MKLSLRLFLPVLCVAFVSSALDAEELNALDYLPPDNFVAGWEAGGNEFFARPEQAGFMLGETLPLLQEFGAVWYATETYYAGSDDELTIEIIQFPSNSDAFGYYQLSPVRHIEKEPSPGITVVPYGLPPACEIDTIRRVGDRYLEGYRDRFFFRLTSGPGDNSPITLLDEALYVLSSLPGTSLPADMVSLLPQNALVRGTERYIRGPVGLDLLLSWKGDDVFGFDEYSWKAVAGEYRLGGGKYCLLVIAEYDDETTAGAAAQKLQEYFQNDGWETVMVSPLRNGLHPRAFKNNRYAAFWPNRHRIWLLWDVPGMSELTSAFGLFGN